MAKLPFFLHTILFFIASTQQVSGSGGTVDPAFGTLVDDAELTGLKRHEKLSHFKFYWHDTLSGSHPTSVIVVPPVNNASTTNFGSIGMFNDPLTLGPKLSSKIVGRAQGFLGFTSQEEISLLMAMNFVFFEGKYNGSGFTVFGRNPVFNKVREMPVIGGHGVFRFARGYALARTYLFNNKTNDAIVEYNVYVMHY